MRTLGGIVGAVKCINNVIAAIMTTKATKRRRNEIKRNKRDTCGSSSRAAEELVYARIVYSGKIKVTLITRPPTSRCTYVCMCTHICFSTT